MTSHYKDELSMTSSFEMIDFKKVELKTILEGDERPIRPLFSKNGLYLFVIIGESIHVYSAKTGVLLNTLNSEAVLCRAAKQSNLSRRLIVSCFLNPKNDYQLFFCTNDGYVLIWDFEDAVLLESFHVGYEIKAGFHCGDSNDIFLVLNSLLKIQKKRVAHMKNEHIEISVNPENINMESKYSIGKSFQINKMIPSSQVTECIPSDRQFSGNAKFFLARISVGVLKSERSFSDLFPLASFKSLCVSSDSSLVGICEFRNILVLRISHTSLELIYHYQHSRPITCFAIHSSSHTLAIGDTLGQIHIQKMANNVDINRGHDGQYSNLGQNATPNSRLLHWHAHSVRDLSFSEDGNYLFSAGDEGVLVQWHLLTGNRRFLPRLGGAIDGIVVSHDKTMLGISLTRGLFHLVNFIERKISQTIHLSKSITATDINTGTFLAFEPRFSQLVVRGSPGTIRFLDPNSGRIKRELTICGHRSTTESYDFEGSTPIVEYVAFSASGTWMVTVDFWRLSDEVSSLYEDEFTLKFWCWNNEQNEFVINTTVVAPHSSSIVCVIFNGDSQLYSASKDGTFKSWHFVDSKEWICRSVSHARSDSKDIADLNCGCLSSDGSVLAVSSGRTISLWVTASNTLLTTLVHPEVIDKKDYQAIAVEEDTSYVRCVSFLSNTPFLISMTKLSVCLWDIRSCDVVWTYRGACQSIITDPIFAIFALISGSQESKVIFFQASSPVPLFRYRLSSTCISALLVPASPHLYKFLENDTQQDRVGSCLFFLTADGSLRRLACKDSDNTAGATFVPSKKVSSESEKPRENLLKESDTKSIIVATTRPATSRQSHAKTLQFDVPSHTIPPIGSWFSEFVDTYLPRRSGEGLLKENSDRLPSMLPTLSKCSVEFNSVKPHRDDLQTYFLQDMASFFQANFHSNVTDLLIPSEVGNLYISCDSPSLLNVTQGHGLTVNTIKESSSAVSSNRTLRSSLRSDAR